MSTPDNERQSTSTREVRAYRPWYLNLLREAAQNNLVVVGFIFIALIILLAIFAPVIAPHGPNEIVGTNRLKGPSLDYPFGTDNLGRDVLSRVFFGVRTSLVVSTTSIFLGSSIGTILGLVAGYLGNTVDTIISRTLDVFFGIPTLLLAITLSAVLGTSILNPITAIGIVNIPFFARLVRGPTLEEKEKDYVQAARAIGANSSRIVSRHVLPNVIQVVFVQSTVSLSYAILIEAALGFVGLGVQPPTPSLGNMLNEGRTFLEIAPWFSVFPGLAITVMILSFNLVGDGLRDALDPTMRSVR